MQSGGTKLVIYIDRNRLDFYIQGAGVAMTLQIPQTVIQDIEIVNVEQFVQIITAFLTAQKITNAQAICVLSPNIVFEKNFPAEVADQLDEQMEEFVHKVPFEHVISKAFSQNGGYTVYASNEDLIESLTSILEQNSIHVDSVVPLANVDSQAAINHSFSVGTAQALLQKFGSLKTRGFTLGVFNEVEQTGELPGQRAPQVKSRKRLFVYLGIFAILVVILIVMVVQM